MTIMGNTDAALQAALATLIQAIQNLANRKNSNSDDDEEEEAEVDNDLLTYRKTTTVVEINVNLQAIAKAGLTIFDGIGEALRAKGPDPLAVMAATIERQRKAHDANLAGAINAVFGGSALQGIDPQVVKKAVEESLRKLERVTSSSEVAASRVDSEVTLDQAGLSDLAAQVVAMIPAAMICDVELPARLHRLVHLFVPTQHHLQVREALLNAAQARATEQHSREGTGATFSSGRETETEQPGQA